MKTPIYIIFALEDNMACDRLIDQARNSKVPVEFQRMLTKVPWAPLWKAQSRSRIFGCEGAIFLISKNTNDGVGLAWELACVKEAGLPLLGVQVDRMKRGAVPEGFGDSKVIEWNWPEIETFIQSFTKRTWGATT